MRRLDPWIPWLLLALGLAIRFWHYTTANISMDEPFTLFHSQKPIAELLDLFRHENNPPLFFLIMHYWIGMFGLEPEYVRIVPVVISAITTPIIYIFGKKHFTKTTGIAAALLFLFSDLHQYHAHDVRAYSLFTLLAVLSLYYYLNLKAGKWKDILLLGFLNALLLYNHFFGAIILIVQGFSILSIKKKRAVLLPFLAAGLVSLTFYAVYIPILWERFVA
jgi:mannosyltransferase